MIFTEFSYILAGLLFYCSINCCEREVLKSATTVPGFFYLSFQLCQFLLHRVCDSAYILRMLIVAGWRLKPSGRVVLTQHA